MGQQAHGREVAGASAAAGNLTDVIDAVGRRAEATGLTSTQVRACPIGQQCRRKDAALARNEIARLISAFLPVPALLGAAVVFAYRPRRPLVRRMQVLSRVSAQRPIPAHHPEATSADAAYKLDDLVSKADLKALAAKAWVRAVVQPATLPAFRGETPSRQVDAFVHRLLGDLVSPDVPPKAQKRRCKWLALFDVSRKVLQLRSGTVLASAGTLAGARASRPCTATCPFCFQACIRRGRAIAYASRAGDVETKSLTMDQFAEEQGLASGEAAERFLAMFGTLQPAADGTRYAPTAEQRHRLVNTVAVCALQAGAGRLSAEQGKALLLALQPMQHKEVRASLPTPPATRDGLLRRPTAGRVRDRWCKRYARSVRSCACRATALPRWKPGCSATRARRWWRACRRCGRGPRASGGDAGRLPARSSLRHRNLVAASRRQRGARPLVVRSVPDARPLRVPEARARVADLMQHVANEAKRAGGLVSPVACVHAYASTLVDEEPVAVAPRAGSDQTVLARCRARVARVGLHARVKRAIVRQQRLAIHERRRELEKGVAILQRRNL